MLSILKRYLKYLIPTKILIFFIKFKELYLNKYSISSYSQEGEDMILRRIFDSEEGFYVDVGAHHPKRFSNTYFFYKKGWKGINIDAQPSSMKLFNKIRPRDINIEKGISDSTRNLDYYMFDEPALNSFSKEISKKRNDVNNFNIVDKRVLKTTTLANIFEKYLPKNQQIDFLSVDVEGLDYNVLKSNNFNKYLPKVITVEILESTYEGLIENEIVCFLKKHNYEIISKTIFSTIFIQKTFLLQKGFYETS